MRLSVQHQRGDEIVDISSAAEIAMILLTVNAPPISLAIQAAETSATFSKLLAPELEVRAGAGRYASADQFNGLDEIGRAHV